MALKTSAVVAVRAEPETLFRLTNQALALLAANPDPDLEAQVRVLRCDYFKLSPVEGEGTGESLRQFPMAAGEHILADRGYCHASGIHAGEHHSIGPPPTE